MSIMSDDRARWTQVGHGQWVRREPNVPGPQAAPPEVVDTEADGPAPSEQATATAGSIAADATGGVARRPSIPLSAGPSPVERQVALEDPLLNPGIAPPDSAAEPNAPVVPDDAAALNTAVSAPQAGPPQGSVPREYVPDPTSKPGAKQSAIARAAAGSTTMSRAGAAAAEGAASVAEFAQSTGAQMVGAGGAALGSGNAAELLAHGANFTRILATAAAQSDPMKQAAYSKAQAKNAAELRGLDIAKRSREAAKTGKVGEVPIDTILDDRETPSRFSSDEQAIAAKAKMILKRNPNYAIDGKEVNKSSVDGGVAQHLAKAASANLKLGIAGDTIGAKKLHELTPQQTMGTAVAPELVKDGQVVSRDSRPENSWWDTIANFTSSLNPWSSRPVGNTAKLTDSEQADVTKHEFAAGVWDSQATHRKNLRNFHDMASGGLQDGYLPEEYRRKTELKEQISALEGTAASEKSARSSWYRPSWTPWGPRFNEQEQQKFDDLGSVVSGQDERVKASKEAAIAGHQSELDKLEEIKAANLGARSRNLLPWKSGSYHFTEDEEKTHSDLQSKVDALTAKGQKEKLTADDQGELDQLREQMNEMVQVRETGLSRQQRQSYGSLQTSIAATKKNDLFGLSDDDIVGRQGAIAEQAEMTTTLKTGLNKSQREELKRAKSEREEQRQFKKTGLTKEERDRKAAAEERAKGVYRSAEAQNSFLDKFGGKAVREAKGAGGKTEYRVGGLKHDNVTDEDTATTTGGWFARAGETVSGWLTSLGEFLGGKSKDATKHIDRGELLEGAGITAMGAGMESAAFAVPGAGGLARRFMGGLGDATKGVGRVGTAAFGAAAADQKMRDEQLNFTSGGRNRAVATTAVDWHGAVPHEESSATKEIVMGLGGAALGAGSAFYNTSSGQELKEHVLGKSPDPNTMSSSERLKDGAKKAGTGAVTDNLYGIGTSIKNRFTGGPAGPTPEAERQAARMSASAEEHRAAQRAAQDEMLAGRQAGVPATEQAQEPTKGFGSRAWDYLASLWSSTQDRSGPDRTEQLRPEDMSGGSSPSDGAAPDDAAAGRSASADPINIDEFELQ